MARSRIEQLQARAAKRVRQSAFQHLLQQVQKGPMPYQDRQRFLARLMREVMRGTITPTESNRLKRALTLKGERHGTAR